LFGSGIEEVVGILSSRVLECDPAAGGADHFTFSIGHTEGQKIVIDLVRGRRATKPEDVVSEIASVCANYRVRQIVGDKFSGMWVQDAARRNNLQYIVCDKTRTELFVEMLGPLHQGYVDLPKNPTLIREMKGLERRTLKNGREEITHGPGNAHDDYANSVAIVVWKCSQFGKGIASVGRLARGDGDESRWDILRARAFLQDRINERG
jgi:hypothetical protein